MIKWRYFVSRLKLLSRPFIISLTVVIAAVLCCLPHLRSNIFDEARAEDEKIKVGIVGNTDNKLLKFGIEFIENADESRKYLSIVVYDSEKDGYKAVENGDVSGCVIFTEEFLKNVTKGKNLPLKYITKSTTVDVSSGVVNEILDTVTEIVVDVQTGAFSVDEYLDTVPDYKEKKLWSKINAFFIDKVLERDKTVELVQTDAASVSLEGYYFSSVCVLLALILGFVFSSYLIMGDCSLHRQLSKNGCGVLFATAIEYLSYLLTVIVIYGVFFSVLGVYSQFSKFTFREFVNADFMMFIKIFANILPSLVLLTSMQFFVYSLCKEVVSGTVLQFVFSVGFAYASGCFYPSTFFPRAFVKFINMLPVGRAFVYIQHVLCKKASVGMALCCIAFSCVLFACSVAARKIYVKAGA